MWSVYFVLYELVFFIYCTLSSWISNPVIFIVSMIANIMDFAYIWVFTIYECDFCRILINLYGVFQPVLKCIEIYLHYYILYIIEILSNTSAMLVLMSGWEKVYYEVSVVYILNSIWIVYGGKVCNTVGFIYEIVFCTSSFFVFYDNTCTCYDSSVSFIAIYLYTLMWLQCVVFISCLE